MKAHILFLTSFYFVLLGSCQQSEKSSPNLNQEKQVQLDPAIVYHLETAASDLKYAIKDATTENVHSYLKFVKYAQITIPQTINLCKEQGKNELAEKLTKLDAQLTEVLNQENSEEKIIKKINDVANDLENLAH